MTPLTFLIVLVYFDELVMMSVATVIVYVCLDVLIQLINELRITKHTHIFIMPVITITNSSEKWPIMGTFI